MYDTCFYTRRDNFYVYLYGDDVLLIHKDKSVICVVQKELKPSFDMVDLGPLKGIWAQKQTEIKGINIIKLHQKTYVKKLLKRFNMLEWHGIPTPVEKNLKLTKENNSELLTKKIIYRINLLSDLFSCRQQTRFEFCSQFLCFFSRFQSCANDIHSII